MKDDDAHAPAPAPGPTPDAPAVPYAEYRIYHLHTHKLQHNRNVLTYMTCRPTAEEPLMACAAGVVLDHPAPLAE
jgi:hypothetical protein